MYPIKIFLKYILFYLKILVRYTLDVQAIGLLGNPLWLPFILKSENLNVWSIHFE